MFTVRMKSAGPVQTIFVRIMKKLYTLIWEKEKVLDFSTCRELSLQNLHLFEVLFLQQTDTKWFQNLNPLQV